MTVAEMNRRLASMDEATELLVRKLVREGWGAQGIFVGGANATMKQINAVFQSEAR